MHSKFSVKVTFIIARRGKTAVDGAVTAVKNIPRFFHSNLEIHEYIIQYLWNFSSDKMFKFFYSAPQYVVILIGHWTPARLNILSINSHFKLQHN